ncbi:MAG: glycosyltransferase family 8 protein [Lachnospiraceae bacterium]|nr:glycosyltransferase family 8 protein [Lachnospiraceae bacterium]
MSNINILYQCDDNYAPYTGVSLTSLLRRNKKCDRIDIYILDDGIKKENKLKLIKTAENFGRGITFIDTKKIVQYIKSCNMPPYRGGYTTYLKLFVGNYFKDEGIDIERLVYIDSDTIILGDISELASIDMGDNVLAMVCDSLTFKFKNKYIGLKEEAPYFNAGFVLFNMKQWQNLNISDKIREHLVNKRAIYANHEQDILNAVLNKKIMKISPKYNFQPIHDIYTPKQYFRIYKQKNYYSVKELEEAKSDIRIYHTYRFIGVFPWDKNDVHPANALFDREVPYTEWKDFKKKKKDLPLYMKIERLMFKYLPRMVFLKIFQSVNHILYSYTNRKSYKANWSRK